MKTINKIIVLSIYFIVLLSSCNKEKIEVVKNLDTSWEVDEEVVKNDIRTRLGYDPSNKYVVLSPSLLNYSIPSINELIFSTGEVKEKLKATLTMGKVAKQDLKVTLEYDPSLYNELKSEYGGYVLGTEDLIKLDAKQKIIPAGETSVEFQLSGNITEAKRIIFPYSLKIESDEDISMLKGSEHLVLKIDLVNFLNNKFRINFSKASANFSAAFKKIQQMPTASQKLSGNPMIDQDNIVFNNINGNKKGIDFSVVYRGNSYSFRIYLDIDESNFSMSSTGQDGRFWSYFGEDLEKVIELINSNAPYKYEKVDNSTVKVISVKDPDMWFTMEKQ